MNRFIAYRAIAVLGLLAIASSACATTSEQNSFNEQSCVPVYKQVYQPPLKLGGSGRVRQVLAYKDCSSSDSSALVSIQRAYELVNLAESHDKKRLNTEISNFLSAIIESDKSKINLNKIQRELWVISDYLNFHNESLFLQKNINLEECERDWYLPSGKLNQSGLLDCLISKNSRNSSMLYEAWVDEHFLLFNFIYLSRLYGIENIGGEKYYKHWRQTFGTFVVERSCYREQYCSMTHFSYLIELQMLYLEYLYESEDVWRKTIERLMKDKVFLNLYSYSKFSKTYPEIFSELSSIVSHHGKK